MFQSQLSKFQRSQERAQALQQDTAAAQQRAQRELQKQQQQQQEQRQGQQDGAPQAAGVRPPLDPKNWRQDMDYYNAKRDAVRAPITQKIKRVVDLLKKERRGLSLQEIEDATLVDATTSADLQATLLRNPVISLEQGKYRYKPKHDLKGEKDLLRLIRDHKDGLLFEEVADSYPEVRAHVDVLKAAGEIRVLPCSEGSEEIVLYPNDPKVQIKVDQEVVQEILKVELPGDFSLVEKHLRQTGQKPCTSAVRQEYNLSHAQTRAQAKPKAKRKRESRVKRTTNDHLPELFHDQPSAY